MVQPPADRHCGHERGAGAPCYSIIIYDCWLWCSHPQIATVGMSEEQVGRKRTIQILLCPVCAVFSHPQIAAVGMSEEQVGSGLRFKHVQ